MKTVIPVNYRLMWGLVQEPKLFHKCASWSYSLLQLKGLFRTVRVVTKSRAFCSKTLCGLSHFSVSVWSSWFSDLHQRQMKQTRFSPWRHLEWSTAPHQSQRIRHGIIVWKIHRVVCLLCRWLSHESQLFWQPFTWAFGVASLNATIQRHLYV